MKGTRGLGGAAGWRPRASLMQTWGPPAPHALLQTSAHVQDHVPLLAGSLCLHFLTPNCVFCFAAGTGLLLSEMEGNYLVSVSTPVLPEAICVSVLLAQIQLKSFAIGVIFLLTQEKPNTPGPSGLYTPHSLVPHLKMSDKWSRDQAKSADENNSILVTQSVWMTQRKIPDLNISFQDFLILPFFIS